MPYSVFLFLVDLANQFMQLYAVHTSACHPVTHPTEYSFDCSDFLSLIDAH